MGTRVLVTGVGGGVGQSILKSLAGTEYEAVALDPDPFAAGLYAAGRARLGPLANDDHYVDVVSEVCREQGCALVFPGFEPELLPLALRAGDLREEGILAVVSSPEVVRTSDDKWATAQFLRLHGFTAPDTRPLPRDLRDEVDSSWFPFILKPQRGGARSRSTYLVRTRDELDRATSLIDPDNCVMQEYLSGEEYTCGTVNFDGACHGVIVMRRELRDGDTYKAWVVRDRVIEDHVRAVAEALAPFGPCNFQLRMMNGRPCIFEINARCSGTTYARALAGFNEPKMVADRLLHGVEPSYQTEEITILRYWKELRVDNRLVSELQSGEWIRGNSAL